MLHRQIGAPGQRAQVRHHGRDSRRRAGNRAVHTLGREKDRAFHPARPRDRQQRLTQRVRIVEPGEAIERRDADRFRPGQWTKRATTSRYERLTFTFAPESRTRKHSPLVCGFT